MKTWIFELQQLLTHFARLVVDSTTTGSGPFVHLQ